jgi:hypothetical protein
MRTITPKVLYIRVIHACNGVRKCRRRARRAITINYCTVSLHITTHDAGMLTDKDYTLAEAISLLVTN